MVAGVLAAAASFPLAGIALADGENCSNVGSPGRAVSGDSSKHEVSACVVVSTGADGHSANGADGAQGADAGGGADGARGLR